MTAGEERLFGLAAKTELNTEIPNELCSPFGILFLLMLSHLQWDKYTITCRPRQYLLQRVFHNLRLLEGIISLRMLPPVARRVEW